MKAKRIILYGITDLLIRSRIEHSVSGRIQIKSISSPSELEQSDGLDSIIVCDLANPSDLEELVSSAKQAGASLLGFYPHVHPELGIRAKDAGVDQVVPRSALYHVLEEITS